MKNIRIFQFSALLLVLATIILFTACNSEDDKPKEALITEFAITNAGAEGDMRVEGIISDKSILVIVPFETNLTALRTEIKVSDGATVVPASGIAADFSSVRSFFVANGDISNTYQVTVELADPTSPVLTGIIFRALSTGNSYPYQINQAERIVTVTFNNLQSSLVAVESVDVFPAGATYTFSGGSETINLNDADNTVTISFAGDQTVYTIESNRTAAGFDPSKSAILLDRSGQSAPEIIFDVESSQERTRNAAFDGRYVFVSSRKAGNTIYFWDLQNPSADPLTLPFGDVVTEGTWVISDVRVTGSYIYASNMADKPGQSFKVYRWSSLTTPPEVILSFDIPEENIRLGDAISIIGTPPENGYIFASSFPDTDLAISQFYVFNFNNSPTPDATVMNINPLAGSAIGQYGRVSPIPGEPDRLLVTGAQMGIGVMDFMGNVIVETSEPSVHHHSFDPNVFEYNAGRYLSFTVNRESETDGAYIVIINITEGQTIEEAIGMINSGNIEEKQVLVKNFSRTGSLNWSGANNSVSLGPNGKPRVMGFALKHGFIVMELSN